MFNKRKIFKQLSYHNSGPQIFQQTKILQIEKHKEIRISLSIFFVIYLLFLCRKPVSVIWLLNISRKINLLMQVHQNSCFKVISRFVFFLFVCQQFQTPRGFDQFLFFSYNNGTFLVLQKCDLNLSNLWFFELVAAD